MQKILLLTTNKKRASKYQEKLKNLGLSIELEVLNEETPELQGESVEEVAKYSASWGAMKYNMPVLKEDASFEIPALNNFPGIYVKHMNMWLGAEGYLKLMMGIDDRRAYWYNVLCYAEPSGLIKCFSSKTWGTISEKVSNAEIPGTNWSVDLLWLPENFTVPIAEIDEVVRKRDVWTHDKFKDFKDWYIDR
jgi:non-canonical purine NTP pyrophosphatase (RdgB/HAM1 family)